MTVYLFSDPHAPTTGLGQPVMPDGTMPAMPRMAHASQLNAALPNQPANMNMPLHAMQSMRPTLVADPGAAPSAKKKKTIPTEKKKKKVA